MIEKFYNQLARKYAVKRLREPTECLGWSVTYGLVSSITIKQPYIVHKTVAKLPYT